ncbi:hypothetical protein HRI_002357200 [Hibiscus trionum]|uniref:Endonuclease/exonuclease/phosphatase domain-containing protein n=1 Tax=Hibiscus trionum TaxID=183268 RepID=A0A9W7HYL2_HIBTR|nr:hypothetical protein HRI_002357200 [Hibiscus trionum]
MRDNKPDVVVFMEPRISGHRAESVIAALGFPHSHRVEAAGFSGGIWVAWYDRVSVSILSTHFQFINFRITHRASHSTLLATAVYASPSASGRKALWNHLHNLAATIRSPWIIFGDFNATLSSEDRQGCSSSARPSKDFHRLMLDHCLRDMGYSGPDFTWSRGLASVRLDRFICNVYFDESYPEASVQHLLRMRSDHRPIFLQIGAAHHRSPSKPFRYFSGWNSHEDFSRMVLDNWVPASSLSETIQNFTSAADTWNKLVFGYVGTKKRMLMGRLRGIQRALSSRFSRFLKNLEGELLVQLEHLLDEEELLWRQKSRSDWISMGDRNTRYFHRRAIARRQRSCIKALQLSDGTWCDDDTQLKEEAVQFFQ